MKEFSIGIDLGGTRVKLGLLQNNRLLEKVILEARSGEGLPAGLQRLEPLIDGLLAKHGIGPGHLQGIGLAFPGIVDPVAKKIISTNGKYDDGPHTDPEAWVAQKWHTGFFIDNDTRMAAAGEWIFGAGRGSNDLVVVTLGTGVGSSVIMEGRLVRGKHFQAGCLGGHFTVQYKGHACSCGNIGCVEAQASTWSLGRMLEADPGFPQSSLFAEGDPDFYALFKASRQGDALATRVKNECLDIWAAGIVNLVHAYDPEIVVLGGGVMNSRDEILPYLQEKVWQHAWCPWGQVILKASELMDDAAILGVAYCLSHLL